MNNFTCKHRPLRSAFFQFFATVGYEGCNVLTATVELSCELIRHNLEEYLCRRFEKKNYCHIREIVGELL